MEFSYSHAVCGDPELTFYAVDENDDSVVLDLTNY